MGIPDFLRGLVSNLSEENYEQTVSDYRFWRQIGGSSNQLYNDIIANIKADIVYPSSSQLIHRTGYLLLRFVTDLEIDAVSSTHTQLCRPMLNKFFSDTLEFIPRPYQSIHNLTWSRFYTDVNFLAHWVNLGYVSVEDVRDRILQSLTFQPTLHNHRLYSLLIFLKIAGATFAAYVDPLVMERCLNFIKHSHFGPPDIATLAKEVIKLSESGWEGLPRPPNLCAMKPEKTTSKPQDPAATPVATPLGLPNVKGESTEAPSVPLPTPGHPSDGSTRSSAPPSPSTSISALSDFTIADSVDGEPVVEPETITPHDAFYFDDGSVEVTCGMTLFRVHTSILSLHSPVLRQMLSSANLTSAELPGGCLRIVSSDTPSEFAALLKAIYLPGFPEKSGVPDFSTFSSLLKVSTKYEMPNLRAQMLESIRDAYPENFEGLDPSKMLGEDAFSRSKPHPNAVLNLLVQQKVTSALPMAYYMAVRRGLDSLMDPRTTLSGQTLKSAIRGLMALQAMELTEIHRIIFISKDTINHPGCSTKDCPSRSPKGFSDAGTLQAYQRVFDRIVRSATGGTRILQVLSADEFVGEGQPEFCPICTGRMEVAHADLRRRAWAALPEVFGLKK